jgi:hypothetical protein
MRSVYRALAYIIAAEVVVQAMLMVYAIAGENKWINNGGVLDKAVVESRGTPFPEVIGIPLHGMNGSLVIPALALLLLISSFFAKIPGGVKWAALVFLLVAVQANLGYAGNDIPALGALHGVNALMLFTAALHTARRRRVAADSPTAEAPERLETSA